MVGRDGSIYFTDPTYGRMPVFGVERPTELDFRGVYRIAPDRKLHLFDFDTGKELTTFTGRNGAIICVAISPDGRFAATTCQDHRVRIFRMPGAGR